MSFHLLSGRMAQIVGFVVALAFGTMWLGTQVRLPLVTPISQAFLDANGTPGDMLFIAGVGTFIFVVSVIVFAIIGDAGNLMNNLRDLRRSGWR